MLVSQIYVTRPQAYPQMAAVTEARSRGEQALRDSTAACVAALLGPAVGLTCEVFR